MSRPLLALSVLLALAGCDRPLVDPVDSQLLVTEPDLSVVRLEPGLTLRFDTASPLAGSTVGIEGEVVPRDTVNGGFVYETTLELGLNRLRVEIVDAAGEVTRDTLYALYLPVRFSAPVAIPNDARRIGAAAAPFGSNAALVTGGVSANGLVSSTGTVVSVIGTGVSLSDVELQEPRTSHTASVLPGGQVLLLGGIRTDRTPTAADFVGSAEVVAAADAISEQVLDAEVLRAGHTTRVLRREGRTYLYVFGGIVPAGTGFAESGTADIFEYVPGTPARLDRLSPPGGVGDFPPLVGGVQIPTAAQESVVYGLSSDDESVAFQFVWRFPGTAYPFSLTAPPAQPLAVSRDAAAGVSLGNLDLGNGLALVIGGRGAGGQALASLEVYASEIDRTFAFPPEAELAAPRFGHTATILSGGRIVVIGGQGPSGPASFLEVLQL